LIVPVQRQAGGVEGARAAKAARLGDEHVVFAVPVLVDPLADGCAQERWRQALRPRPSVREDPAVVVGMVDPKGGSPRRNGEFDLAIAVGRTRHARRPAQIGLVVVALSAFGRVGFEDRLVLWRKRSLLIASKPARAADRAPLSAEVGVFRLVQGPGAVDREAK